MDSDSDSAPEEENIKVSAKKIRQQEQQTSAQRKALLSKEKEKRRKQNEFFTQQKRLPQALLESLDQVQDHPSSEDEDASIAALGSQMQMQMQKQKKASHKTFHAIQKGPVMVRVAKKQNKVLAPKKESMISKKNKFLHRKSIRRK